MNRPCPRCQHLNATNDGSVCPECQHPFTACCPDCQYPLHVLKACGAIDYFCQQGHGLISKKRLLWLPVAPEQG